MLSRHTKNNWPNFTKKNSKVNKKTFSLNVLKSDKWFQFIGF